MDPQTALAEKEDDHIEDDSFPAGKVKDGFYIDNENLPAGKTKCEGKKRKNVSIKDQPKPKKRSKTSALMKIAKQISTLEQTLNARMSRLEQSVWSPVANLNLYRQNKPDNMTDANSAENNTCDEGFGVDTRCMIKIFRGGAGVVTPSKPPPPYEQLLPLPTPYFKMFLERSLNDSPPPTTPLQAPFTATPSPSTTPSPLKILIIH